MTEVNQLYYAINDTTGPLDRILFLVEEYLRENDLDIKLTLRDVRVSNPRVVTNDPYLNTEIDFRIIKSNYKGPKFTVIRFNRNSLDHSLVKVFNMGNNIYHISPIDHGFDDIEDKDYTEVFVSYLKKDTALVMNAIKSVVFKDGKYNISFKEESVFNSDKFVIANCKHEDTTVDPLNPPSDDHEVIIDDDEGGTTGDKEEEPTEPPTNDSGNTDNGNTDTTPETPDVPEVPETPKEPEEAKLEIFYVDFGRIDARESTRYPERFWFKELSYPVITITKNNKQEDVFGDKVFAIPSEEYYDYEARQKIKNQVTAKIVDNKLVIDYGNLDVTDRLPDLKYIVGGLSEHRQDSNPFDHVYTYTATDSAGETYYSPAYNYRGMVPTSEYTGFQSRVTVDIFEDGEVRWLSHYPTYPGEETILLQGEYTGIYYFHQVERLKYVGEIYVGNKYVYRAAIINNSINNYIESKEEGDWNHTNLAYSEIVIFDSPQTDDTIKSLIVPKMEHGHLVWQYDDSLVFYTEPKGIWDFQGIEAKVYRVYLDDEGKNYFGDQYAFRQTVLSYTEDSARSTLWTMGYYYNTPLYICNRELTEDEHKSIFSYTTPGRSKLTITKNNVEGVIFKDNPENDYEYDDQLQFTLTIKEVQ